MSEASDRNMEPEAPIKEEFPSQGEEVKNSSGVDPPLGSNTNLWDSLWKPVKPVFCLACDTMFTDRFLLEQHTCPFVNFICSCGISFHSYTQMWNHSSFHNPNGTCLPSLQSAIENRMSAAKEQETKLKRLEETAKNICFVRSPPPIVPSRPVKRKVLPGQIVNMWHRFKPVVKLQNFQRINHQRQYRCGICHKLLLTQDELVEHVSIHAKKNVYGCRICGLLLIGRVPPRPGHRCGLFYSSSSERFTIGKVQKDPFFSETHPCPYCSVRFCNPRTLNKHIITNHGPVQPPIVNKPSIPEKAPSLRCALCRMRLDSLQMLVHHWCTIRLPLAKPEALTKVPIKRESPRSDPYPLNTNCSEVTFRFQKVSSLETCSRSKLLTIKSDPVELNVTMTQTDFPHVSVKSEPECDDQEYGVQKGQAAVYQSSSLKVFTQTG